MARRSFILSRRSLIGGMASSGGLLLTGCNEQPPTYGNILRMGDNFTYNAQRSLLSRGSLAREYGRADITSMPAIGTVDPANMEGGEQYGALQRGNFADWRLEVTGSVYRPASFGLSDIKRLRARTQITKHMCEEGWSAIAEWTGVPLRTVLEAVGMKPSARFVQFHSFDGWADSVDLIDAFHPQTILAYGMNGRVLPIAHGAPLRLRVERQIGYKSLKFLRRIVVADHFDDFGKESSWAWHVGI